MANVSGDISYCIGRIEQITRELNAIADALPQAARGIHTERLQDDLRSCADRYQRAKRSLQSIHK